MPTLKTLIPLVAVAGIFTTTYQLTARLEGYSEPLAGVVRVGFWGDGEIEIFNADGTVYCHGETEATVRKRGRTGSSGVARLTCVDGRKIEATWYQSSYTTGKGVGKDQSGARISFTFTEEKKKQATPGAKEVIKLNAPPSVTTKVKSPAPDQTPGQPPSFGQIKEPGAKGEVGGKEINEEPKGENKPGEKK